jgi:small subunit ribosomal protein S13
MLRIAGINVPGKKRIEIALTHIYGIGDSLSRKILKKAKIDFDIKTEKLSGEQISKLREIIEGKDYKIEGDLRRDRMMNVKRLKEIGTYRGSRHSKALPVRGQKTKTNSRTTRGNVRKTMLSGRRKGLEKT